jgi:hypothetical protein
VGRKKSGILSLWVGLGASWLMSAPLAAADWPSLPPYMNAGLDGREPAKVVMTGPNWPKIPAGTPAPVLSPFAFEIGARYWYSSGSVNFGFANSNSSFGDPTSTIDWDGTTGHSGEIFGRFDYRPAGLFVKGLVGGGILSGGTMIDRDFSAGQFSFSDTSSNISGNGLAYGIVDFGATYNIPYAGVRLGAFLGYHYWREKLTANGFRCNPDDVGGVNCAAATPVAANVPVLAYEPTWNALRIGADAQIKFLDRWTLSGEFAGVPYAQLTNNDSHLLRTAQLGPVPNIIDRSTSGYGAEAEVFVNYALTPKIEIGAGLRYWGLFAQRGTVDFGPSFSPNFPLQTFNEQRYGVLLQIKGKF